MRFFLFLSGDGGVAVELARSAIGGEVFSVEDIGLTGQGDRGNHSKEFEEGGCEAAFEERCWQYLRLV